jgi:hypothetical protein
MYIYVYIRIYIYIYIYVYLYMYILGSPIFHHVRIWRGKCVTKTIFGEKITQEANCDYTHNNNDNDKKTEKIKKTEIYHLFSKKSENTKSSNMEPFTFPLDSSYLDIVAYGSGSGVSES